MRLHIMRLLCIMHIIWHIIKNYTIHSLHCAPTTKYKNKLFFVWSFRCIALLQFADESFWWHEGSQYIDNTIETLIQVETGFLVIPKLKFKKIRKHIIWKLSCTEFLVSDFFQKMRKYANCGDTPVAKGDFPLLPYQD